MWYILIDSNGYFITYSKAGISKNGCTTIYAELPSYDEPMACKWVDNTWVFDEEKYQSILKEQEAQQEGTLEEKLTNLVNEQNEMKEKIDINQSYVFSLVDAVMGG